MLCWEWPTASAILPTLPLADLLGTSVLNLKFDGLQIDSMIADSPGFGEDWSWVDALPLWGLMRWNALS